MAEPQVAPYGSWKSPITSDLIVSETIGLGQIVLDGEDVYWVEMRPAEGGRNVIVRRTPDGRTTDVTPAPFNARSALRRPSQGERGRHFARRRRSRILTSAHGPACRVLR